MPKTKTFLYFLCYLAIFALALTIWGDNRGFGVDSFGHVYMPQGTNIAVYHDGEQLRTIQLPPFRTYHFTVQRDDTILLSSSNNVYVMDLYGNEVSENPDRDLQVFYQLQRMRDVETANGDRYRYSYTLGWKSVKNESGDVVYHTPVNDYIQTLAFSALFACAPLGGLVCTIEYFKKRKGRS